MPLSDIVSISITTESAKVEQAGFGMPLILAADCPGGFTERVRFYTSLTAVLVDFATSTVTYKMAAAIFAQNPRVTRIAVGRLANKPTQTWTITPVVANSTVYALTIDGVDYEITSDASATATEICDALRTAISASGLTEGGTATLTLTATVAGAFHSVEVADSSLLKVVQDHADPGLAADLAAIALEDSSSWYALLFGFNSKACVDAISDFAEANKKLFIAQTQESDVVNLSNGSDTGGSQTVAGLLKADSKFRTALVYHPDSAAYADAALAGKCLPFDPGSETWAFKTLAGVSAVDLTDTQRTNALAKYVNVYETLAGVNVTNQGKVSGNEWIDVIRFRDWLEARMSEEIFGALANAKKIPFTDGGISVIEGIIRAQLRAGVVAGGLAEDPAPVVTVPLAADVSSSDKAARRLTGVKFDATLAGAIQAVEIDGVISV